MSLLLFPADPTPRQELAERLRALAAEGIYFGTSSWKYEGWLGSIYTTERYLTRGRFSHKKFEAECLTEYAETFPVVCGDFSFYQFPSDAYWQHLFASAPEPLQFAFKVPEEITVREWPKHARYGGRAGLANESYLDARLFEAAFLRPLEPYRHRVAVLIFEFGTMSKRHYECVEHFAADIHNFLAGLPAGWRYAVEIRNREFFDEPYLDVLRHHGAAHVFNSWSRMPELDEQAACEAAFTADFTVARALLRPGRMYEQAVSLFQPYAQVQEPHEPARQGLTELAQHAHHRNRRVFLFINNRLEGNAPGTIDAVITRLTL